MLTSDLNIFYSYIIKIDKLSGSYGKNNNNNNKSHINSNVIIIIIDYCGGARCSDALNSHHEQRRRRNRDSGHGLITRTPIIIIIHTYT